jgi:hypothetical protein
MTLVRLRPYSQKLYLSKDKHSSLFVRVSEGREKKSFVTLMKRKIGEEEDGFIHC